MPAELETFHEWWGDREEWRQARNEWMDANWTAKDCARWMARRRLERRREMEARWRRDEDGGS